MAQRVYGSQVVALGWILDFDGFRVSGNLLTAWALASGFADAQASSECAMRLRRRATGGKRISDTVERLVEHSIDELGADDAVLAWVGGDRARRLYALVACTRPLHWTLSDLVAGYAHLEEAANATIALPLAWERALTLAQGVGATKVSPGVLQALREIRITSSEAIGELAGTCGVYSDDPSTRAAAAFAAVAAGMAHSPIQAVAAVCLLVCSHISERFACLPFKTLEGRPDGVGPLSRWAAEYYIRCETASSFGVDLPASVVSAGLDGWAVPTVEGLVVELVRSNAPDSLEQHPFPERLPPWISAAAGYDGPFDSER